MLMQDSRPSKLLYACCCSWCCVPAVRGECSPHLLHRQPLFKLLLVWRGTGRREKGGLTWQLNDDLVVASIFVLQVFNAVHGHLQ